MDGRIPKPVHNPATLVRVSEHFLRSRHFDDCRKYAHRAYQIDPNFPGVSEILAVVDVLLASNRPISTQSLPDWYAVMQLNRYSQDSDLIRQRFHHLCGLINPTNNNFPFASEAFDLVLEAWYVLSNPVKKLEYDDSLKKLLDDEQLKGDIGFSFWTACPYCYYVYEFPRVYLELCLMCQNEKCSKAFTCVEIDRPPVEVLREGKYMCAGFLPVGFQDGGWNPFAPLKNDKVNVSVDDGKFVEISDDNDNIEIKPDESLDVSVEGVHEGVGSVNRVTNVKLDVRRKKSVAKKAKKVTGTGNRVTKEGVMHREGTNVIVQSTDDNHGCGNDFSCASLARDLMNVGDVEFYDAGDDILVSL